MAPAKAAQEDPEGGWRLDHATENTGRPTSTQCIGVVDEVAASQRGGDQRQQFVPRVRPPRRPAEVEVMVDEFPQAQVPGEGGRQEQAGIGHQAAVVKGDADAVGIVLWQHLVSWFWRVKIPPLTCIGVRQTGGSLVMEDRLIARVAASTPERARTVAWANQALILQGRADAHIGGIDGKRTKLRGH